MEEAVKVGAGTSCLTIPDVYVHTYTMSVDQSPVRLHVQACCLQDMSGHRAQFAIMALLARRARSGL